MQLLGALATEESVGDDDAAVRRRIANGNGAADPFVGPQNGTEHHKSPKAGEETRQEHQCFLCRWHVSRREQKDLSMILLDLIS